MEGGIAGGVPVGGCLSRWLSETPVVSVCGKSLGGRPAWQLIDESEVGVEEACVGTCPVLVLEEVGGLTNFLHQFEPF